MDHHVVAAFAVFAAVFLFFATIFYRTSKQFSFLPYTVILLVLGFATQYVTHALDIHMPFTLSHDAIYYILLPLLLFESAYHIDFHQFRIQFKTISFLATVGLLISVFTVAFTLSTLAGLSFNDALLFGAIISATDPIAVITLFKSLGAPKRLALLADGESMFNDATGVIMFRVVSGFVLAGGGAALQANGIFNSVLKFLYMFGGSLVLGLIIGYIFSLLLKLTKKDAIIETTLTIVLALGSFLLGELVFGVSGVITTVMAAIVVGNLEETTIAEEVRGFMHDLWAFFAFVSVSLVFFFSTFNLNLELFIGKLPVTLIAIFAVLLARSLSVYVSVFLTNRLSFFKDEPNIPMSWQHILNWGGLRGVIPLVLVYSLPDTYEMKDWMIAFTLGSFLFTLFVNGLTIQWLLKKLGLHLPRKSEQLIDLQNQLIHLEEQADRIKTLNEDEYGKANLAARKKQIQESLNDLKAQLIQQAGSSYFEKSLRLAGLMKERNTLEELHRQSHVSGRVYREFEVELDIQTDAVEYPITFADRAIDKDGMIRSGQSYRHRIHALRDRAAQLPFLKSLFKLTEEQVAMERIELLHVRIWTSQSVIAYFKQLDELLRDKRVSTMINGLIKRHMQLIAKNEGRLAALSGQHAEFINQMQKSRLDIVLSTP